MYIDDMIEAVESVIEFSKGMALLALSAKVSSLRAPRELSIRIGHRTYTAIFTPDLEVGGYSIEVPELKGVFTEADTIAEARRMAKDAIQLWLSAASASLA